MTKQSNRPNILDYPPFVVWYSGARETSEPRWAMVTGVGTDDVLSLRPFIPGERTEEKLWVHRMGSDALVDARGRPTVSAQFDGGWDYHPNYPSPNMTPVSYGMSGDRTPANDPNANDPNAEEVRNRVSEMLKEGLEFDVIHRRVRQLGVSKKQLQAIVDELSCAGV